MTIVNHETGEILDAEAANRRAEQIGLALDGVAERFEVAMTKMRAAIEGRDDVALGYKSPGDYLSDRFGGKLARLGVDLRREVVRELTEAGLSKRAIAPVVGVSHVMVTKDRQAIEGGNSVTTSSNPSAQEAARARIAERETKARDRAHRSLDDLVAKVADLEPERPVVVGIDGKSYTRTEPKPKPVLTDSAADYDNAEKASKSLSNAIAKLLEFQHPNMREAMRRYWSMASTEVPPTPRRDVTPEQMRVAAHGLLTLADEWSTK